MSSIAQLPRLDSRQSLEDVKGPGRQALDPHSGEPLPEDNHRIDKARLRGKQALHIAFRKLFYTAEELMAVSIQPQKRELNDLLSA
jgi:hypothetical protein